MGYANNREFIKSIPDEPTNSQKLDTHRKTKHFAYSLIVAVYDKGEILTPLDVCFYETRGMVYCCIWLQLPGLGMFTGSGYASGYGYYLYTEVLVVALQSLGIETQTSIVGESVNNRILKELTAKLVDKFNYNWEAVTIIKGGG